MDTPAAYRKIDCHCHFMPPNYKTALEGNGHSHPDGMPGVPTWSEEAHLELMSSVNIFKSILSISTPGIHLAPGNDVLARELATYCNDYAADLKKRRPDKFGFFASLPLPDVGASLAELSRAFDQLDADGVILLTNHHGHYLGDPKFDPLFEELDRRHARVFIHPTTPCMLMNRSNSTNAVPLPQHPRPMFEFFFDSARAVVNLFTSGTVSRSPNVTFLISHLGGAFPPLIRRFAASVQLLSLPADPSITPQWVGERLNAQFYFDSAGWALPEQIHGLLEHVTADRLLYGSDYCYTPAEAAAALSREHDKHLPEVFASEEDREKLCWRNAEQLFHSELSGG